jgi:zinc protease
MFRTGPIARGVALVLVSLVSACTSVPGEGPGQPLDLGRGTHRMTLSNGLLLVVKEDHRLPTVSTTLAYRVGSVDDPEGQSGMAHYLEHMVFKGTQRYRRGEIDLVTLRSGGENNAYTTVDTTGYWFHVASNHLEDVLEILSDTMGGCTLSQKELDLERGPILEEMNLWLDSSWGELERELDRTVYARCRYRHPILGSREDLEGLTRESMLAHYHTYYTPDKAALVIVGDVTFDEARRRVEQCFGSIPRGRDVVRERPEGPQEAPREASLTTDRSTDRFILAFRSEPIGSPASPTMDVLATLLGEGKGSKLKTRLVAQDDLSTDDGVTVQNEPRRLDGVFSIEVVVAEGGTSDKARRAVEEELDSLKSGSVTDRELRRAKNQIRTRLAFDLGSRTELSWRLGIYEALGLPDYLATYMDRIEAVSIEDVQAMARKAFSPQGRTVVLGSGAGRSVHARERRGGVVRGATARRSSRGVAGAGAMPSLGEVREETLPNGLTLLAHRRSDLPIVTLQADIQAGMIYEPESKAGLAELVSRMLDQGVNPGKPWTKSSEEIAREVEFLGGQYSISPTGISVNLMSDCAQVGFDLLRDLLRNPTFPEDRFDRVREDQVAGLEALEEDPQEAARRLFFESAYRGHPLGRPAAGRKDTVAKLTLADVQDFYHRFYRPENVTLVVVGDLDPGTALQELRSRFESWRGEGPWSPPRIAPAVRQSEARSIHHVCASRQARLHLGHVGIDRSHPDYHALRVMETILGSSPGFTNRLARTIRDEMGLSYDIAGSITQGSGLSAGPFQVVLGVDGTKKDQVMAAVLDVLRTFQEQGPTDEELSDAKRYLVGSFASNWETIEDTAEYLLDTRRFGLGLNYASEFQAAISAVSREDVLRVARTHIHLDAMTTVVVEGRRPWLSVTAGLGAALLLLGVVTLLRRRSSSIPAGTPVGTAEGRS